MSIQLLIDSSLEQKDLEKLSNDLGIHVARYKTASIDPFEVIRIVFDGTEPISLIRDGILFQSLSKLAKRTYLWVRKKKDRAEIQISARLIIRINDDNEIPINIGLSEPLNDKLWKELESMLSPEYIESTKGKQIINLSWDQEKQTLKSFLMEKPNLDTDEDMKQ